MKFEIPAKKVQKVSVDLVVLDREKLEPIFASDVSLLAPQKNEFIADHCIWRRRTCFELWIFYSSRTLNVSVHSSDWNDGWISSGPTCWWARKTAS